MRNVMTSVADWLEDGLFYINDEVLPFFYRCILWLALPFFVILGITGQIAIFISKIWRSVAIALLCVIPGFVLGEAMPEFVSYMTDENPLSRTIGVICSVILCVGWGWYLGKYAHRVLGH